VTVNAEMSDSIEDAEVPVLGDNKKAPSKRGCFVYAP
jgi:hypothetical protein